LAGVLVACLIDRLVYQRKPGKKRIERRWSRVTETIAIVGVSNYRHVASESQTQTRCSKSLIY
jgi:hypothetical protein